MVILYSNQNCSRCSVTKQILKNNRIEFREEILDELPAEEKRKLLTLAKSVGIMSMPIIVKDGQIIKNVQEV